MKLEKAHSIVDSGSGSVLPSENRMFVLKTNIGFVSRSSPNLLVEEKGFATRFTATEALSCRDSVLADVYVLNEKLLESKGFYALVGSFEESENEEREGASSGS